MYLQSLLYVIRLRAKLMYHYYLYIMNDEILSCNLYTYILNNAYIYSLF